MANLKSKFDILRGWPQQSALQEDFIIGGTSEGHKHHQGTWVSLSDSYTTSNEAMGSVDSSATKKCFLIIEGRDDYSSQFANRVTVLLGGGYVVKLDGDTNRVEVAQYAVNENFVAGSPVKVVNGIVALAVGNEASGVIIGTVLKHDANAKTLDVFVH
jgi:hypothetical protein